jgi:drug/metabolite transporter (DMT)-like permease
VPKVILALYVLATTAGLVVLKLGTRTGLPISYIDGRVHMNINAYTVIGLFMYALSFITYVYLISKYDLGFILPLALAFVYILIFIASAIIFKESFTATKIIGICMILGGLIFMNLSK